MGHSASSIEQFKRPRFVCALVCGALWLVLGLVTPQPCVALGESERAAMDEALRVKDVYDDWDLEEARRLALAAMEAHPGELSPIRIYVLTALRMNLLGELRSMFDPRGVDDELRLAVHFARGLTALEVRNPVIARMELERALEIAGADGAPFELQLALLKLDRVEGSQSTKELFQRYERFVERYDDVAEAHLSYIETARMYGMDSRRHRRAVAAALDAPNRNGQIHTHAVELARQRFWYDPQEGLEIVERGLKEFPRDLGLAKYQVVILRQLGRQEEALAVARAAREQAPNHGDFLVQEIEILRDLNRFEEAIAAAEELSELRWQPEIRERKPVTLARLHHYAGNREEAVRVLSEFVEREPTAGWAPFALRLLAAFSSAGPDDRVTILPRRYYMEQRGNYCGPATLNMILRTWGIEQPQEEIARRVYTGIAGTPPQVIGHYVRPLGMEMVEFKGDDETWKRLLDAGFPILWLQMLGSDGGHYRVVTGYDDVLRNWFVHDPNNYEASEFRYDATEDRWILPSLRRSIVIVPEERANDPALEGLRPTSLHLMTNWFLYIATGANLFVAPLRALALNVLVAIGLGFALARLMRGISFPNRLLRARYVVGGILLMVVPLNLAIGLLRTSGAVSVLLGLHIALATLLPLLVLVSMARRRLQDFLHPRETLGFSALVVLTWLSLSFIDRAWWEVAVPVALFVVGVPLLVWPRLVLRKAEKRVPAGLFEEALEAVKPMGGSGLRYFPALVVEMDCLFSLGRFREVGELAEETLAASVDWPADSRNALELHGLFARALDSDGRHEDLPAAVERFLEREKLAQTHRLLAEALRLYLGTTGVTIEVSHYTADRVEELMEQLARLGTGRFPGLPGRLHAHVHPVYTAALLMGLRGAMRMAEERGDAAGREELSRRWSGRFGLLMRLIGDLQIDQAPAAERVT